MDQEGSPEVVQRVATFGQVVLEIEYEMCWVPQDCL